MVVVIHPETMPVPLTTLDEMNTGLETPWEVARELRRPLPDGDMLIVSRGNRKSQAESRWATGGRRLMRRTRVIRGGQAASFVRSTCCCVPALRCARKALLTSSKKLGGRVP